jgi:thymidylate synthase (FAD)
MNIVKPYAKLIIQEDYGKKIEYAGRVCYRSENKINSDSYKTFISNIIKSNHLSVLEHESVSIVIDSYPKNYIHSILFENNKFLSKFFEVDEIFTDNIYVLITANLRTWYSLFNSQFDYFHILSRRVYKTLQKKYDFIFTNNIIADEYPNKELYIDTNIIKRHTSETFEVQCSRSISHQFVRHRLHSFSQESQRYCNYSNDKFNKSINFIMPESNKDIELVYKYSFERAEDAYFYLIKNNIKPEQAREVLPNAVATKLIMTANISQWERFLQLRTDSHAQYEAQLLALEIQKQLKELIYGV